VIAALPGMTPEVLNDFLKQRPSLPRDQKAVAAALGPAVKAAGSLPETRAFRVLTTIRFDNGRRTSTEAVILLASAKDKDKGNTKDSTEVKDKGNGGGKDSAKGKEPYRILSWQDQVESLTRPSRRAGG
jgi:general secretion pathway protein K